MNQELKIEGLTITEANLILNSLGKLPYDNVANLINKLKVQFETQLADNPDVKVQS